MKYKKLFLFVFFGASFTTCVAQKIPTLVKSYYHNNGIPFGGFESLILSSDSIFFFALST